MTSAPPTTLCCPPLLDAPLDEHDAVELASVLKALADPVRLRLVSMIAAAPAGEVCACDLAIPLGKSQPTISHHLSQLVAAGILDREQRGRWAWFRVRLDGLDAVRTALAPGDNSACETVGAPRPTRHDGSELS